MQFATSETNCNNLIDKQLSQYLNVHLLLELTYRITIH